MQAQEYQIAKWSIGQRARDVRENDVTEAIVNGTILRTHVLRPTWHFVLPADIRWMLALTAPRIRAMMRSYDRKLELDGPLLTRAFDAMIEALDGGRHRTRTELADVLHDAGIEARGQRLAHVVMHAELDALVASGAPRGKQQTYALLEERAPATRVRDEDEALAELATRYFASRGPATSKDFRWWSSLTAGDAKRAIEAAGNRIEQYVRDERTWFVAEPSSVPRARRSSAAHLLQIYDEYIVAYTESRDLLASDARSRPGMWDGGRILHAVVLEGRLVAQWRYALSGASITIEIRPIRALDRDARDAIAAAAERFTAFHGAAGTELTFLPLGKS
jgi:hypothetical protein